MIGMVKQRIRRANISSRYWNRFIVEQHTYSETISFRFFDFVSSNSSATFEVFLIDTSYSSKNQTPYENIRKNSHEFLILLVNSSHVISLSYPRLVQIFIFN